MLSSNTLRLFRPNSRSKTLLSRSIKKVLGELCDVFLAGVVHGYTDYLQTLGTVLLLKLNEPGHLDLARRAPGGPEVQQHRFAAEIGKMDGFVVEGLQSKLRRRVALDIQGCCCRPRAGTAG